MRRILIIDDQSPAWSHELVADLEASEGSHPEIRHINPSDFFSVDRTAEQTVAQLIQEVSVASAEFWDVIAIDLFLGDFGFDEHNNLLVCLQVAEAARYQNKCTSILLYSGTLAKYIQKILGGGTSDTHLRQIFHSGVANFFQRNRIASEVSSAIDNPPWLLRVDRLFTIYQDLTVMPEEAEFSGRNFADLARQVRRQDDEGQKITQMITEYGIAAFTDLNS